MNTDEIIIAPALRADFSAAMERGRAVLFSAPCGYGKTAVARALLGGRQTAYVDARAADFTLPDACGDWDTLLLDELPALRGEDCRALCALLRDAPDKRFVLLSRGPVPGWLLPLRAAGGLAVFSRAALALGQDEALRLLRARGAEPAAGQINDILRRTEGCPLALILAAPHLRSGGYTEETAAAVRAELFDYFDTAIFRRFDAGLRRFLLHLAPYGRFDLRLADRVCGGGAGELLDRLMGESALLCGDGVDAYRFHPFFRNFLLWEAERELGERERAALLDRAGSYYERRGETLPALDCYVRAGDREKAAAELERCADPGPESAELPALARCCDALPETEYRRSSGLLRALAMLRARQGDYAAAERAYRDLSALSEPGALRWLDLSLPQRTAAELAAALAQEGEIPPVPLTGGRASALNGAHDLSALTEAELAALAPRIDALPGCFGAGACLCAERRFLAGGDISMLLPPLLADMREVRCRFAPETELAASALLARVRLDAGRPAEARRSMETLRARLVSTGESRLLPTVDALTLQIDLRGAAAEAAARTYLRDSAPAGPIADVWQLGLYLTRAMAELALGRDADALETLAPLPAICEACHRRIDGVTAALLRAAALRRLGRPWEAEAAGALDKAEAQGLCRAVSALGAAVLPLLGDRRGALADAVREQTANFPSFLCAPAPAAAVPLTAAEKQVLRLLAEGRSNAEIAEALGVGLPTVKTHVSHILKKLGLSRRAEARAAAGRFL